MSKRDDDSQADMEVGMTTAERRRRRRRGGGLRVPSDNVPRRTTPPVVPPVPEDPSLAMSIAYSFTSDASEPIPRATLDPGSGSHQSPPLIVKPGLHEPMAPDAMQTVIDPPSSPVDSVDFEMKTREMNAVDLEALGLASITTTDPMMRREDIERPITQPSSIDVDLTIDSDPPDGAIPTMVPFDVAPVTPAPAPTKPVRERKERLRTVALSEEDLEEVRDAVRAATQPASTLAAPQPTPAPAPISPPVPHPPPTPMAARTKTGESQPVPRPSSGELNKTMPLTALDVEMVVRPPSDGSLPEIDLNDLAERSAEASGEIEVDVAEDEIKSGPIAAKPATPIEEVKRQRPPSVPPPIAGTANGNAPHPPPPPPPVHAQHKPPPAPPPAKKEKEKEKEKSTPRAPPAETKPPRGKPWFVDLFDEDYLRTLPFLTPQATQAEAEFVIDAMGLSPGAQVLDIGCGYGRHAMELAARGYHVVGLDLSTPLLVRGGEEAHRRGLSINFIRGDMRELDFEGQFDAAYCLFSTFGYFDDETNKKTIANIARALKPGGRVLIEILNRDYVIADLPTRVWWEGDGCVVLEEVELNYFSSRIQVNRSVVFDDGRQLEQEISVRAYSLHEVGKLMHSAGFRVLEVSGGYQTKGRFFGNQSRHIIVLAERKDTQTPAS